VLVRCSMLPSYAWSLLEALAPRSASITAYPTAGIIYASWPEGAVSVEAIRDLRRLCVDEGHGALVLEQAPVELKREAGVWGDTRGDFALMRRLKDELDPKGVLNPGRFVGGI
jgi:FAD/FMN-containing dehydrogenase